MTTVRLEGDGIPDFLEFLNISPEGALLRFTPDIQVEVLSGSQVLASQALIDGGYARRTGDAYGVTLEMGGKAVVRMGGYKLMLKVDPLSDAEILAVQVPAADQATCGKCATNLRLVLAGGGALTPCGACGSLNRVTLAGTKQQQLEDQATRIAMPAGVLQEEKATPEIGQSVDPGSSTGRAISDLPTFDAISVMKDADAQPEAAAAIEQLGKASGSAGAVSNLASPETVDPGSSTGRPASDLPTFDAIAVLKDDAPAQPKAETVNLAGGGPPPAAPPPQAAAAPPTPPPQAAAAPPTPPPQPSAPQPSAPQPSAPQPSAPQPVATPPTPAPQPAVAQEKPVTESPAGPPEAQPDADDETPATGQWEETLTIQAVKPKSKSILPWIALILLAVFGLLGIALLIVLKVLGLLPF